MSQKTETFTHKICYWAFVHPWGSVRNLNLSFSSLWMKTKRLKTLHWDPGNKLLKVFLGKWKGASILMVCQLHLYTISYTSLHCQRSHEFNTRSPEILKVRKVRVRDPEKFEKIQYPYHQLSIEKYTWEKQKVCVCIF